MIALVAETADRTPLWITIGYFGVLLSLGLFTRMLARGTSSDYFVASRSIGPFLLLMSVFGTTMTAFALVGSTGKSYELGVGVYGLMASASGILHSLVFFIIGIRLWAIGKRYGYHTQVQFFRERFDSHSLGYLLFPVLVGLVIPYLLIGLVGAGTVVRALTVGMFPDTFPGEVLANGRVAFAGSVPPYITELAVAGVVLFYIFTGGLRAAAWANALQTMVFMVTGVVAFVLISRALGGMEAATAAVLENSPEHLQRSGNIGHLQFLTYAFVPLSVGMFPHLFQHWLTAKSAKTFRLTAIAHPVFIMIVWVPCILIGIWAAGAGIEAPGGNANAILGKTVGQLIHDPWIGGLLLSGILAAIMSSLDSQFVCLGTMFTHDIVLQGDRKERFSDTQKVVIGRLFIVAIVIVTYLLSQVSTPKIFDLAVWSFSGFGSLFPIVFGALYWRRLTKSGVIAAICAMVISWSWLFNRGFLEPMRTGEALEGDYLVAGMMPVTIIFAITAVTMVVVSLMTSPPPKEVVDRFFFKTKTAETDS